METKHENITASSLPVPCVQEMAKKGITTVPPRYICPDEDQSDLVDATSVAEVPVIDLQSLISKESMNSYELDRLHFACKDWGFFQLVNHGVSSNLLDKIKKEMEGFFNLSMGEKKKFWQTPNDIEGFGQVFVRSEEQNLDWADIFFTTTSPTHMRKPHLLPNLPLPFRDTLETYTDEVKNLAMTILAQMAKALKMDSEEMREMFKGGLQTMRTNYYPPCPEPEKVIGLTPHTDGSALTILLQVSEVEGLQIKKDGKWVPIKPLPNAFIVNIGNALEIITNGSYRSIQHRAVVNSEKERLSIAMFHFPKYEGFVGPANSLVCDETPALFRRVSIREYLRTILGHKLRGRSIVDSMRI